MPFQYGEANEETPAMVKGAPCRREAAASPEKLGSSMPRGEPGPREPGQVEGACPWGSQLVGVGGSSQLDATNPA